MCAYAITAAVDDCSSVVRSWRLTHFGTNPIRPGPDFQFSGRWTRLKQLRIEAVFDKVCWTYPQHSLVELRLD